MAAACSGSLRSGVGADDDVDDPDELVAVIAAGGRELQDEALTRVVQRNGMQLQEDVAIARVVEPQLSVATATLRIVEADELYRQDLETFVRILARARLLESWASERGADGDDRRGGRGGCRAARANISLDIYIYIYKIYENI